MSTLAMLGEAVAHTFTQGQQDLLWSEAKRRANEARSLIAAGVMQPHYDANTALGHVTGVAGEWVVADALTGWLGEVPQLQYLGWDVAVRGLRIDVKTWPVKYVDAVGHSVNTASLEAVSRRQYAQNLNASVIAMTCVQRDQNGTPQRAWWYAWTTTDRLLVQGHPRRVQVYGKPQQVTSMRPADWLHPHAMRDRITGSDVP